MNNESAKTGCLTLISTPIGNLSDLSERSIEYLRTADCIACEDTRVTGKLLSKLKIEKSGPLVSYREENEKHMATELADRVAGGERIALVADAGMPAISDPGFRLVRECQKRGLPITCAPGATAATTALALSGLPTDGFLFTGFLPPKAAARKRFFEKYQDFEYTIIIYESCHRISKFLNDVIEVLGEGRCISVARELTKLHESIHSGPADVVRDKILKASQKGEFVVCIAKKGYEL
ncbi:16S rRNA (cytidine(1402)-2'-O)-methyltransferase [Coraliomargarita sinensis]|uniref:Ribosomal RNA small subunit methyltransferase I n=1 Tax=Coraliomargarita sinensis TaxID=2174842 RepID=A0A317ZGA6_9BACT|nr:16S rRNA (cytidine(1402)-2'-O)-methyltransferase [Coraliomargarita sinensis]PXA03253.1 16S rRNA (cytidine(1402)-2'-O)-methyltransferase [Coraliomargarita sinensis]